MDYTCVTICIENNRVNNVLIGSDKECMDHFEHLVRVYSDTVEHLVVIKQYKDGDTEIMASITDEDIEDDSYSTLFDDFFSPELVYPSNGGCWYCYRKTDDMLFSSEYEFYVHEECIVDHLEEYPDDMPSLIMAEEFSLL